MSRKDFLTAANGVLVIDKPQGPSSHDVVASIRRVLKVKKVGHTGTLDPTATGVLPLVLGQATKLARYFTGGDKTYLATMRLGISTETLDAAGAVTRERPVTISPDELVATVKKFVGQIEQIPPMYSAKKIQGQKLYELARQGVEVPREAKCVTIYAIKIHSLDLPSMVIEVQCSVGTYVRVLAQDIGEAAGCGAHLAALQRLRAGSFTLEQAMTLHEALEHPEKAVAAVVPIEVALKDIPSISLPSNLVHQVGLGYQLTVADLRNLDVPSLAIEQPVILRADAGAMVAVARTVIATGELGQHRRDARALKTERVLVCDK
jgi:tRNA pseudouridine55 synthase